MNLFIYASIKSESGISLISMSMMLIVLSCLILAGSALFQTKFDYKRSVENDERLRRVQDALADFYVQNGRYPCPASLQAPIDTPEFGVEVDSDCTAGAIAGTERSAGRAGEMVRTGTVPVRTLGLRDDAMFDSYRQRLVYAVTESYAVEGTVVTDREGAIFVEDMGGNNATAKAGNIVQLVLSGGGDENGMYSKNGVLLEPCRPSEASGENCNFSTNAVFKNTPQKSTKSNNLFVHNITYSPPKIAKNCGNDHSSASPRNVAFLIDTSGSMGSRGECPATMPDCRRIDAAHWALRRILPAIAYSKLTSQEDGTVLMTGFQKRGWRQIYNDKNILKRLMSKDIEVFENLNPESDSDIRKELFNKFPEQVETELQNLCPSGATPLGAHIKALADRMEPGPVHQGGEIDKLVVLSDGLNNRGNYTPVRAAQYIRRIYPHVQVDIIDVVGNPELREVSDITGGKYYRTDNPTDLLDALYTSAGVCRDGLSLPEPVDKKHC